MNARAEMADYEARAEAAYALPPPNGHDINPGIRLGR